MGGGGVAMWSFSHLMIFSPLRSCWYLDWCCILEEEKTSRKQNFFMILPSVRLFLVGWVAQPELYWGLWCHLCFFPHRVINVSFSLLFMYLLLIARVTKRKRREILAALALLDVSCSQFWRRMALLGGEKQQSKESCSGTDTLFCVTVSQALVSACPDSLCVMQWRVTSNPNSKFRWRVQAQLLQGRSPGVGAWRWDTQPGLCSMQGERSTASAWCGGNKAGFSMIKGNWSRVGSD